jgi:membrane-bound acyltransferase YfiQ involved in biofilm formation
MHASRRQYLFVDNARFLSVIAIVIRHCELSLYDNSSGPLLESAITQFRTFGVQLFFVVTAFLMADWLEREKGGPRAYWLNRWRYVAVPWVLWAGAYVALDLAKLLALPGSVNTGIATEILRALFFQSYWYVPVLFFSTAVLLGLQRFWTSYGLGMAFLALSLMYGVNQYTEWLPTSHTVAVLGYLFSMWIGVNLYYNFDRVSAWARRRSWTMIVLLVLLGFSLTLAEDRIMESLGFVDTYNALQITNQIYAVAVLLALLKLDLCLVPALVDVRKDSYGIYLTHQILATLLRGAVNAAAGRDAAGQSLFVRLPGLLEDMPYVRIALWFMWSALVYCSSLGVTKLIRRTSLGWTVGVRTRPRLPGSEEHVNCAAQHGR